MSVKWHVCIPCADEIDAIAAKRENAQREMERRIVAQMLTCMDDLCQMPDNRHETDAAETAHDREDVRQSAAQQARHVIIIGGLDSLLDSWMMSSHAGLHPICCSLEVCLHVFHPTLLK